MQGRSNRRAAAGTAEKDCADCSAAVRCWRTRPRRGAGIAVTTSVVLGRGERAFAQGDRYSGLYIVAEGCIKLRETMSDGGERIVAVRTPGELVGLEGWVAGRHPHAAIAAMRTKLCRVELCADASPDLLVRLLAKASEQLHHASRPWAGRSALERVAAFVTDISTRLDDEAVGRALPMTRAEVASHLGLAEETVVRALGTLRKRA